MRADRRRLRSQRGLTLIELTVAMAITAVIALSLGAAIALSIRLVGPDGAQGQQVASTSLLATEGRISTDVSRAECVITSGMTCPAPTDALTAACQPGFAACVAWCAGGSAQGASYFLNSGELRRTDTAGTSLGVALEVQSLSFDATIPPGTTSPQLTVTLTAGTNRPQHVTFTARSAVTGGAPCP